MSLHRGAKLIEITRKNRERCRLRDVEKSIAESKGKSSGLVTAKDVFVVLCGIAAVVISSG